jgi:hypothetical protein
MTNVNTALWMFVSLLVVFVGACTLATTMGLYPNKLGPAPWYVVIATMGNGIMIVAGVLSAVMSIAEGAAK